jgi:threonine/homoserine/homoserine lactone efflux protein
VSHLLAALIPYGLAAAAAAPAAAVVSALVLGQAKRPVGGALFFVAGALALDVVVSVVLLGIFEASGKFTEGADIGAWIDAILGGIFVLIGVFAIFQTESPEKTAARRARIERLTSSGPARLLLLGVAVQIVNSDSLAVLGGGLKEVAIADVSVAGEVVGVAWVLLLMLLPYYVPVVMYAVAPQRASVLLRSFSDWLFEHSRVVEIVTGLVLGGLFLWKGLAALA